MECSKIKLQSQLSYDENWPGYQKLQLVPHSRVLRSSKDSQLQVPLIKNTLQEQSAHLFNQLPEEIRNCRDYRVFYNETKNFLVLIAWSRLG